MENIETLDVVQSDDIVTNDAGVSFADLEVTIKQDETDIGAVGLNEEGTDEVTVH